MSHDEKRFVLMLVACVLAFLIGLSVRLPDRRNCEPKEVRRIDCGPIHYSSTWNVFGSFDGPTTTIASSKLRCKIGGSVPVVEDSKLTLVQYDDGTNWVTWDTTDYLYKID